MRALSAVAASSVLAASLACGREDRQSPDQIRAEILALEKDRDGHARPLVRTGACMAQILIKRRQHFAEAAQPPEWSDLKWSGRPRAGTSWRSAPTATGASRRWTGEKGWNREAFALIEAPNVSEATIAHYAQSYSNASEGTPATVQLKRRYQFDLWASIPWIVNTVTVGDPPVQVEEWYYRHMAALGGGAARVKDKVA